MAKVKMGTSKLTVPQKIQFVRAVIIEMTGNPNFVTPAPTLAAVGTAATSLETGYGEALAARMAAKAKTAAMEAADDALDVLVSQLANYVQNTSGGQAAKIESSGFGVCQIPAPPIGPLSAPTDIVVTPNEAAGTMNMDWQPVRGANSYTIERAVDAPVLAWTPVLATTKSKAVVNTMTSGTRYWLRVAAIGTAGQGPWSNAIAKFAT